jgi:hypothetical protein
MGVLSSGVESAFRLDVTAEDTSKIDDTDF